MDEKLPALIKIAQIDQAFHMTALTLRGALTNAKPPMMIGSKHWK
jgi:hypothetical protein